jgi:hypothetical protein
MTVPVHVRVYHGSSSTGYFRNPTRRYAAVFNPFARYERVKPGECVNPDNSKQVITAEEMRRSKWMVVAGGLLLFLELIAIITLIVLWIMQHT